MPWNGSRYGPGVGELLLVLLGFKCSCLDRYCSCQDDWMDTLRPCFFALFIKNFRYQVPNKGGTEPYKGYFGDGLSLT